MTHFTVGQVVKVSDKRPKPPKHHSKKLKEWESNHFNGIVIEIKAYKNCIVVKNTDINTPIVASWNFEISLDDAIRKVEPIISEDG